MFKELPLFVAVYADLPDDEKTMNWLMHDSKIFAAFRVREGEHNILLFEFHKDLSSHDIWRDELESKGVVPPRKERTPSVALYFSNSLILKYEPNTVLEIIREKIEMDGKIKIGDCMLDKYGFKVLNYLTSGEGIRINENHLAKIVGIHRSTLRKRIHKMQQDWLILPPLCQFPFFFILPSLILVFSMLEVKSFRDEFVRDIIEDPHVSIIYKISKGKYNLLLFECHESIEDYLQWEEKYKHKYPFCFGAIKNQYISPKMAIHIDPQKVSLGIIQEKLNQLNI